MLRQDYSLSIHGVQSELPVDDNGLDITTIWDMVRAAIRDIKGWEVTEEVVLSTFSFTKYLMWKDLVDRTDQLKQNAVVRHLIDTPREAYGPQGSDFPAPAMIDRVVRPSETFCPLIADSSQLSAIFAAARGKDFVLIGPPGSGKSQTITNMIAQCLAEGKKVLFVAEKMVALEVVHRRLRQVGLGDFCLELHSNKAKKTEVLEQLRRARAVREDQDTLSWEAETAALERLRDELNSFVARLHQRHTNGLSPFEAMARVIAGEGLVSIPLQWPNPNQHDTESLRELRDIARRLDLIHGASNSDDRRVFDGLNHLEWSPRWQNDFIEAAKSVISNSDELVAAIQDFCDQSGIQILQRRFRSLQALSDLGRLLKEATADCVFGFQPRAEAAINHLAEGLELVRRAKQTQSLLSREYGRAVTSLNLGELLAQWRKASNSWGILGGPAKNRVRKALAPFCNGPAPRDCGGDLEHLVDLQNTEYRISEFANLGEMVGPIWNGVDTDLDRVQRSLVWIANARRAIRDLGGGPDAALKNRNHLASLLSGSIETCGQEGPIGERAHRLCRALEQSWKYSERLGQLASSSPSQIFPDDAPDWINWVRGRAEDWVNAATRLRNWCAWRAVRADADSLGLEPLATGLERSELGLSAEEAFEINYCRWWIDLVVDGDPILRRFMPVEHQRKIEDFRKLDDRLATISKAVIRARICAGISRHGDRSTESEWGVLSRELNKKRRHMPLRQLVRALPNTLTRLTPCILMSPLSVAQYLPTDFALFDVIIFDEASQIPVWDAIGSIARGRQAVIVGDPKQLPPTSFFDRSDEEMDEDVAEVEDLESILDECLSASIPASDLRWHYRSKHESLIAFSNHRYYGNALITFPSPVTEDRAVQFVHVPDGTYEKGGARVNKAEARTLVDAALSYLRDPAFQSDGLSLGVITFNSEQQRLIEDLLDDRRRKDPSLEQFFAEDASEPVFVKNLENVQGDERDIILFSITYGPDLAGKVSMNFGPINKQGGERRLNVAITRARRELKVFATLRADQIDLSRTTALGVRDLKHFLEFSERGSRALAEAVTRISGRHDSPLEATIADALAERGWVVHAQVGVSGSRIDLGVVHSDFPGRYLAGIECDGASYHRAATARDRDKLREHVLKTLGWRIFRVWSMDWWVDKGSALDRLDGELKNLLAEERARRPRNVEISEPIKVDVVTPSAASESAAAADHPPSESPRAFIPTPDGVEFQLYRIPDLRESVTPDPERFFEAAYTSTLLKLIDQVIVQEGPVKDEVLIRRIARVHGFQRAGSRIRSHLLALIPSAVGKTREGDAVYFWPSASSPGQLVPFRRPGEDPRGPDEISIFELGGLAETLLKSGARPETIETRMARALGLQSLRESTRLRFGEVISTISRQGAGEDPSSSDS